MATYTLEINEKTQTGKKLLDFLKSLGFVKISKSKNIKGLDLAINEMEGGKTTKCKDFDEYLGTTEKLYNT
ncbi:MAG: hypothetical protein PHE56_14340 [Bacteroidales bacterium]|nr:hypothetical protein [Bacteroidales bacterium]